MTFILATVACSAHRGATDTSASSASSSPTPSPLLSCETRELHLDGADVIVQANVDATLGSIVLARAPDAAAGAEAVADAQRIFGDVQPDTRRMNRPNKWGVPTITDPCGRPLSPSPAAST